MSYQSRFYSPAKFDSDQKDVLISQLKAEIFELRQNDRDFSELSSHLKNLEQRYTILSDEKLRSENDLRQRNEQNMKTIANLRTDLDTLKSNITEKHIEAQELRAENLAIKEIADHRQLDISRLKNELSHLNELNTRASQEKILLEGEISALKDVKRNALNEIEILTAKQETLVSKHAEQEKLIRELEYDKSALDKQNSQYKIQNDQVEFELKQKQDQSRQQQNQIQDNIHQISKLQEDIEQLEVLSDKYKQESLQFQKQCAHESNKNFELGTQLLNLETTLKARDGQILDLKKEVDGLKQAHSDAIEQNENYQHEILLLKKRNDVLSNQNLELLNELDLFSDQDEQVRQILNRKTRVKELMIKSETALKTQASGASTLKSPYNKLNNSKY